MFPLGTTTKERRLHRAAYAAAEALVLPVDAQITALLPSSTALAIATTMPRSLNDPVGLHPSSLKYSLPTPNSFSRLAERTRGVLPSPREIIGVDAVSGNRSRYAASTPPGVCPSRRFISGSSRTLESRLSGLLAGDYWNRPGF